MSREKLNTCEHCGGTPELTRIGNDFTKKRSVKITCCTVMTVGSIKYNMEWCVDTIIKKWNTRTTDTRIEEALEYINNINIPQLKILIKSATPEYLDLEINHIKSILKGTQ